MFRLTSVVVLSALVVVSCHAATTLKFKHVNVGSFPTPIGIDYNEALGLPVFSVNYPTGNGFNLATLYANGTYSRFSSLSGLTDEIKIATVRKGAATAAGFTLGDLFVGNGFGGQLAKVSADGVVVNPWISLPGETGLMRGSMYLDREGIFGGALIVCTTSGGIWIITADKTATRVRNSDGVHLEGLLVVPNNPSKFGGMAGAIIAGAEAQRTLKWVKKNVATGQYTTGSWDLKTSTGDRPFEVEDIDLVDGGNFYGVGYNLQKIIAVDSAQWAPHRGDILVVDEFGSTNNRCTGTGAGFLRWDATGNKPVVECIVKSSDSDAVSQWEHVTFAPAAVLDIPEAPAEGGECCTETRVYGEHEDIEVTATATSGSAGICFTD